MSHVATLRSPYDPDASCGHKEPGCILTQASYCPGGGRGIAISVAPDGTPFVVGTDHGIYHGTGTGWVQLPGGGLALDIAIDGSGHFWVIGTDQAIYTHNGIRWTELLGSGRGTHISIASQDHPVVGQDRAVWYSGPVVAKTMSVSRIPVFRIPMPLRIRIYFYTLKPVGIKSYVNCDI
jgi:hypothetical protein